MSLISFRQQMHYCLELNNVKSSHHAVVLVFQIVAMNQIGPPIALESHDYLHLFSFIDGNSALPAAFPRHRCSPIPLQDLEIDQMNMDGVEHAGRAGKLAILQMPDFGLSVANFSPQRQGKSPSQLILGDLSIQINPTRLVLQWLPGVFHRQQPTFGDA